VVAVSSAHVFSDRAFNFFNMANGFLRFSYFEILISQGL